VEIPSVRHLTGLPAVLVLVAMCLAPGCGDEDSPACPDQPIGLVQGFVLGGGKPVGFTLQAMPVDRDDDSRYKTSTDSTGWYSLALPAGAYTLRGSSPGAYYSRDGLVWDRNEADTLIVGEGPIRADFTGGALTVHLMTAPGDTAGSRYSCSANWLDDKPQDSRVPLGGANDFARSAEGVVTFEFPLLVEGTYALECEPSGEPAVWLPPTLDKAAADRVIIEAGQSHVYSAQLPEPAMLTLDVSGSWQTLELTHPEVIVFLPDSTRLVREMMITDAGTGQLSIRAPVSLKLYIEVGGMGRWYGGWTFAEAQLLTLTPGDPPTHITSRQSAILCTLVAPGFGINPEAVYYLYDATGRCLAEDGYRPERYRPAPLPNLVPGTYYLRVQHTDYSEQSWMPQWYDRQDSLVSATPIVVAAEGSVVPVTMNLVEGGSISGRVFKGDGTPYDGPLRVRSSSDSAVDLRVVYTDALTGAYVVTGLADGDYLLAMQFGWSRLCWYPGTLDIQEAEPVRLRDHARLTGVDWQIPPVKMAADR
jgi:hypothetical protein